MSPLGEVSFLGGVGIWKVLTTELTESQEVKHLGVVLSRNNKQHAEERIKSARRAFYSLQGAGLCVGGCSPSTISHIYSTAVRPVLLYGLECVYQDKTVMKSIESMQGKFVKAALGLKKSCRTSPLLQALNVDRISVSVDISKLSLLKSMLLSTSRCSTFYQHLLSCYFDGSMGNHKNLVNTVMNICKKYHISLLQYVCDDHYQLRCKEIIRYKNPCGIADSVKYCLSTDFEATTINNLLRAF